MLPKQYRLPASQFQTVFRNGRKIHGEDMIIVVQKSSEPVSRFAFVVSKKVAKRAVDRNRMKRLMRESVHHLLPSIQSGYDVVFVTKNNFALKSEIDIEHSLEILLQNLVSSTKK